MLNVKLLQQVKEWILQYPEHLDMSFGLDRQPCGTVACIAGTACILSVPVPVEEIIRSEDPWDVWSEKALSPAEKQIADRIQDRWRTLEDEAMELLGITEESAASRLFQLSRWEDNCREYYEQAQSCEERAKVVADYIDYFIQLVKEGAIAI